MRAFLAALIFCALSVLPAQAAHRHRRHHPAQGDHRPAQNIQPWVWSVAARDVRAGGRPTDCRGIPWCGCWLRHQLGIADKSFNVALRWVKWGAKASGPRIGIVVVWARGGGRGHVGIIRGGPDRAGRWLVESGNDGHVVRTRYRSLAGVIAFRE